MTREQPIEPTGGPRVDHRLLATFVAVVESGSFTAAAARLHLTQQAVSAHVARLEAAIGEPLLRRTTRSHHLTPTGEVVLEDARAALSALDGVLTRARRTASGAADRYTLGFTPSLSQAMIPAILSAGSGGPVVELRQRWFDEVVAEVSEGSLDVGIVVAPAPADSIEAIVVGVSRLAVSVRAETVPSGARSIAMADLVERRVALPDRASNPGLARVFDTVWAEFGRTPEIVPIPRLLGPSILEIGWRDVCSPWPMVMPVEYAPVGVVALPIEPAIELDIAVLTTDRRSAATRAAVSAARDALDLLESRGVQGVTSR